MRQLYKTRHFLFVANTEKYALEAVVKKLSTAKIALVTKNNNQLLNDDTIAYKLADAADMKSTKAVSNFTLTTNEVQTNNYNRPK